MADSIVDDVREKRAAVFRATFPSGAEVIDGEEFFR
jgi:hypothetical protein